MILFWSSQTRLIEMDSRKLRRSQFRI